MRQSTARDFTVHMFCSTVKIQLEGYIPISPIDWLKDDMKQKHLGT